MLLNNSIKQGLNFLQKPSWLLHTHEKWCAPYVPHPHSLLLVLALFVNGFCVSCTTLWVKMATVIDVLFHS